MNNNRERDINEAIGGTVWRRYLSTDHVWVRLLGLRRCRRQRRQQLEAELRHAVTVLSDNCHFVVLKRHTIQRFHRQWCRDAGIVEHNNMWRRVTVKGCTSGSNNPLAWRYPEYFFCLRTCTNVHWDLIVTAVVGLADLRTTPSVLIVLELVL